MTPTNKIKTTILLKARDEWGAILLKDPLSVTEEEFEQLYYDTDTQDVSYEFREGEIATDIECNWSRHYESRSVAAKMFDGSWVGWTYWYGGGKHGEPEAIDWMESAYDLECKEEEKLVVVRTFTKL